MGSAPEQSSMTRVLPKTVTILLGGSSSERNVSLRTGIAVARALRSLGHTVLEVDPQQPNWTLPKETDVVFLALHGTYGEDGTVQAHLETLGIPYTGCGPEASRTAFDKVRTKECCAKAGLHTPRYTVLEAPTPSLPEGWSPPVVLKPVSEGSSVGLRFIHNAETWGEAFADVAQHGGKVLMEELIQGRELTVGILAGNTLPIVEIKPKSGAYDYHNKYTPGATEYLIPAPLSPNVTEAVRTAAMQAFLAIAGRDYGRIDILLDGEDTPMVLEVNTLPGMTETSLLPKAAEAAGYNYPALCQSMIDLALKHGHTSLPISTP